LLVCPSTRLKLGGRLADDMAGANCLQTLRVLAWFAGTSTPDPTGARISGPAAVLHNLRRERPFSSQRRT